jgi:hypothetical protein
VGALRLKAVPNVMRQRIGSDCRVAQLYTDFSFQRFSVSVFAFEISDFPRPVK